MRWSK
jgi:hypothetical protein